MTEWRWNDGMRTGWLWLKLRSQKETVQIGASYWSRAQNRGLWLVERTPNKKSKGLTLIRKCPSFHRHSLIQTSFKGQSCQSGMRISGLEWWDDAEMTWMSLGWAHSIVMPSFQCHPIILVSFHHSKNSKQGGLTLASLRFQKVSPPNPLCRGGWVDWLHA